MRLTLQNKVDLCVNDTDCGLGGHCFYPRDYPNFRICDCPRLWNPEDNCKSFFYETREVTVFVILTVLLTIASTIMLFCTAERWLAHTRIWFRKFPRLPKQMTTTTWSNLLSCLACPFASLLMACKLYQSRDIMTAVLTNLFAQSYIACLYSLFRIMGKIKAYGFEKKRYKRVGLFVAIMGSAGLGASLVLGLLQYTLFPTNRILAICLAAGLIIGLVIPIIAVLREFIITLQICNRLITCGTKIDTRVYTLRILTWIMLIESVYMITVIILLITLPYVIHKQLFDSVTFDNCLVSILWMLGNAGITAFIRVTPMPGSQDKSTPNIEFATATMTQGNSVSQMSKWTVGSKTTTDTLHLSSMTSSKTNEISEDAAAT